MQKRPKYFARLLDLNSLADYRREMKRIEVDAGGVPIMAAKGLQLAIYLEQIPTATANCIKQEVLARGGDLATPWTAASFSATHVDCILFGSLTTLRSTISKLFRQSAFELPEVADLIQTVIMRTTPEYLPVSPKVSRQGVVVEETLEDLMGGRIPLQAGSHRAIGRPTLLAPAGRTWRFGAQTYIMADVTAGWHQVVEAAEAGAHLINLPAAHLKLLAQVRERYPELLVAVETDTPSVAAEALAAGATWINATAGAPDLLRVAAEQNAVVVLQHRHAVESERDLLGTVSRWCFDAINTAVGLGLSEEQLIIDPGFGHGKTEEQVVLLTARLRELTSFGRPLLCQPGDPNSPGRSAAVTLAIAHGADIIRLHNGLSLYPTIHVADLYSRVSV